MRLKNTGHEGVNWKVELAWEPRSLISNPILKANSMLGDTLERTLQECRGWPFIHQMNFLVLSLSQVGIFQRMSEKLLHSVPTVQECENMKPSQRWIIGYCIERHCYRKTELQFYLSGILALQKELGTGDGAMGPSPCFCQLHWVRPQPPPLD